MVGERRRGEVRGTRWMSTTTVDAVEHGVVFSTYTHIVFEKAH
jgi:hypothetical protein